MRSLVLSVLFGTFVLIFILDLILNHSTTTEERNVQVSPEAWERRVRKIVREEIDGQNRSPKKLISSCKNGFVRGCVSGFISGGPQGAVTAGVINGVINPIMTAWKVN
jgi:hypothetical protein